MQIKTNHAFKGYEMSYKVELVEKKDPLIQLEVSKSSIKNLLNDLLMKQKVSNNTKSCVKKCKGTEIEFSPVYFNSTTKAVINHKFDLDKSFQEILYRIDNWINESSGQIAESIKSQYMNISTFRALSGRFYVKLPAKLRSPTAKIMIKNVLLGVT